MHGKIQANSKTQLREPVESSLRPVDIMNMGREHTQKKHAADDEDDGTHVSSWSKRDFLHVCVPLMYITMWNCTPEDQNKTPAEHRLHFLL